VSPSPSLPLSPEPSLSLTPRRTPSLGMRLAALYVRCGRLPERSPEALRASYGRRRTPRPAAPTWAIRRVAHIHAERQAHGGEEGVVYTLTPRRAAPGAQGGGWGALYLHGGGFVNPLHRAHWDIVAALVRVTGATVTLPLYPLCPERPRAAALAWLDAVYARLAAAHPPSRLIALGDSAGAHHALTLALRLRDAGAPLPARLALFSPWLDLTLSRPEVPAVAPLDVMLRPAELREWGRWWAGADDPASPTLSPLFADLRALPPTDVFAGTHDVLWPEARALRDRAAEAGWALSLHEAPGGFHDFMAATFTPEARAVYARLAAALGLGRGAVAPL